ncbi:acyl-CoA dehydrogenase family protein [Piscinibacter koreensis]|uniref:Acyl-CoA dehydrogenase family protein n=1 Tax=Piscinibacter koreensis TaxID=2742824 RepID=A0A7Y6NJC8_9BURK|nr:acyl-CoA dehydrogenase family protein [Schlegelella koreensis]NUZ04261.1 acyl-CoA dehydrogenase family protein [Schlegelella koreensis]
MSRSSHAISNVVDELRDANLYAVDPALQEAVRAAAPWYESPASAYGAWAGSSEAIDLADACNRHAPELHGFDARGRRIDEVEFHPSWHLLLARYRAEGLVSLPFSDARAGRWTAFAAGFYLHGQVEAGTLCPATMTLASIPVLQKEPALREALQDKLFSSAYDARDVPLADKASIWVGMGMTEKQGGSDVRSNTTRALPLGAGGRGAEYAITGHKWFFSAPMSDAHLVVARTEAGHSCFWVPRWQPDGSRNAVRVQRLKHKVGNRSNSSSEVEFDEAWGVLLGDEGRGIPTIIEMATHTRLNCVLGSAALIRQALVQALHYARHRVAFGRTLAMQPLMRSVLVDLALESEAALALAMRLARAFEHGDDPAQHAWKRVLTPAAKFWVCKRAVELTGEAMEVFGGNGYIDDGVMGRLYREAPVNSIWEGSGNVMCLDVLRAIGRDPAAAHALLDELGAAAGDDALLATEARALGTLLTLAPEALEARGRELAQRLVLLAQAGLLRATAPAAVADAFVATRFGAASAGRVVGALDTSGIDVEAILERAFPA